MKLDGETGEVLWSSGYASAEGVSESAHDLVLDDAGNAYVTGRALLTGVGFEIVTIKFRASDGLLMWMVTDGGADLLDDVAWSLVLDADGQPVITGMTANSDGSADFYTAKLSAVDGSQIWSRHEPGAVNNAAEAGWLVALPGGDVVMCNRTWTSTTGYDVVLRRYALADGATVWAEQWGAGGTSSDDPRDLGLAADGSPLVCGVTAGNYLVLKIDPATGEEVWMATYDGPPGWYDVANCVRPGPGGSVLVSGYSSGQYTGWDVATCALDGATGEELWVERFDGGSSNTDEAYDIVSSDAGDVYVIGYGYALSTLNDLLTLRYHVDTATPVDVAPARTGELAAWPNPFNPSVELSFELPRSMPVRLQVFDARGRLVETLLDGAQAAGPLRARWDGRDAAGRAVPAGLYLARLTWSEGQAVRKLVLAK